jgi:hypothetical protein
MLHNFSCQQLRDAAAVAVAARYIKCVVAKTAADGRTSYSLASSMLTAMLLGLLLVQLCWLQESVAAGQLLPVEARHLMKVRLVWPCVEITVSSTVSGLSIVLKGRCWGCRWCSRAGWKRVWLLGSCCLLKRST